MHKRGQHYLHYVLGLLMLAVVLAGCGAGGNSDSASDSGAVADTSTMKQDFSSEAAANTASDGAPLAKGKQSEAAALDTTQAVAAGDGSQAVKSPDAEQSAKGAAGFTGSDVVAGLNKKLIYHANLTMEVADYGAAQTDVRNMITLANGYIIEFKEDLSEYEQGGSFIFKVPASGFSSFLNSLEKVKHEKLQRSIQGQDVSEEYVDLESRLKAKELMESQYIEFMKKATKSSDLVAFANQLGTIQEEIEQIKGRMRYIDQNVSFSTVELRLYETDKSADVKKEKEQDPLLGRASDALQGSMKALTVMFQWLFVFLAGALPVLIIAAVIVAVVLWFFRNAKRKDDESIRRLRELNRGKQPTSSPEDDEEKEEKKPE
ncbi:DUF4349 domain-containing protein [Paenibacillus sp. HW567]|uniref:DUF4349 domain-containing protein n=1 Tax=Paenibacillus sp. HW567 TaxID=1034769 RepID=UPI0003716FD6|nr:DUF4349 domain-containing protein [Paenibacillus sp. HW567]